MVRASEKNRATRSAGAASKKVVRLSVASVVGCHGQAQRGHVLREAKHARAYGLGMAPHETQGVTEPDWWRH